MILRIAAGLWVFRLVSSPLWDSKLAWLELWLCKASKEIRLEVYRHSEMKQSTILARKLNPCQKVDSRARVFARIYCTLVA